MEAIEALPRTTAHPAEGCGSLGPLDVQPFALPTEEPPQSVVVCGPSAHCEDREKWPGALWDAPKGTAAAEEPEGSVAHVASHATSSQVPNVVLPERGCYHKIWHCSHMESEEEEGEETSNALETPQRTSYLSTKAGGE